MFLEADSSDTYVSLNYVHRCDVKLKTKAGKARMQKRWSEERMMQGAVGRGLQAR